MVELRSADLEFFLLGVTLPETNMETPKRPNKDYSPSTVLLKGEYISMLVWGSVIPRTPMDPNSPVKVRFTDFRAQCRCFVYPWILTVLGLQ